MLDQPLEGRHHGVWRIFPIQAPTLPNEVASENSQRRLAHTEECKMVAGYSSN